MWELIIVMGAVGLAALWMGRRLWRIAKGRGGGCACESCPCGNIQDVESLMPAGETAKISKPSCAAKEK